MTFENDWHVIELSDGRTIQKFGTFLKALSYANDLMSKGGATPDSIDVVARMRQR